MRFLRKTMRMIVRLFSTPLTLSQAFASLSGALAMVIAVINMPPREFALFALISLAATVTVGLGRSGLFQPALIQQRVDPMALVPLRFALVACTVAVLTIGVSGWFFGIHDMRSLFIVGCSGAFPVLLDWLRFRRIAADERWAVAWADATRLVTVLLAFPLAFLAQDALRFQSYLQVACLLPIILLAVGHRRLVAWAPFRTYRKAASLQLSDFAVGQANSTLPLLLLGGLGASGLLAGVRFAQTIFGPLNLIASASIMNLMADGATRTTHANDEQLVKSGKSLSLRLGAISLVYTSGALATLFLPGVAVSGIDSESLRLGIVLVGAAAVVSGWAGFHSVIMRLLGYQVVATAARTALVAVTLTAFLIGYVIGGVDLSLVCGFLTSAVLYPLAFVVPAQFIYRRLLGKDGGDGKP